MQAKGGHAKWGPGCQVKVVESNGLDTGSVEAHIADHHAQQLELGNQLVDMGHKVHIHIHGGT